MKNLIMHSGGMDSLAIMLDYKDKYGPETILSLGFNYGQRHFNMENEAATRFCNTFRIKRKVLDVPIGQIGGCSLVDHNIPVTTEMSQQRSTVVPFRNGIFLMLAAAVAQVEKCDAIVHGACAEDDEAYRDCRSLFFKFAEAMIQAGITSPRKGSERVIDDVDLCFFGAVSYPQKDHLILENHLDIRIETPLIQEYKSDTMKHILKRYPVDIYKYSYTCYNGGELSCGRCPACQERLAAFKANNVIDPLEYQ